VRENGNTVPSTSDVVGLYITVPGESWCRAVPCHERAINDVIIIKLTAGTQNKIPYKTYISDYSYFED